MKNKFSRHLFILLLCGVLLVGCNSGEQPEGPAPTSASAAIVPTLPPSPTPAPTNTAAPTDTPAPAEETDSENGQEEETGTETAVINPLRIGAGDTMLVFPTNTPPAADPSSFDPPMPSVSDLVFTPTPQSSVPTRRPFSTRTPTPSGSGGSGGSGGGGSTGATATPTPRIDTGWTGDYFNNANLSGSPVYSRTDSQINFNWGSGSPTDLPNDNFSIRWSRFFTFQTGIYRFSAFSDDGVRIYLDGRLVIDAWGGALGETIEQDILLSADTYNVQVEYYEGSGDAQIQVSWEDLTDNVWVGDYYTNSTLSGTPFITLLDTAINFDWNDGPPLNIDDNEDGINDFPSDSFSVRWTRLINVAAGTYRFTASADDGVRVFVNSNLVINEWHASEGNVTYEGTTQLAAGEHLVIVEYYENDGGASINVNYSRQ